ncbi:hypothetical protein DXG03_009195 [Asterophora parasitica]|uniref:Uncharacterized protein n=1 Tax=Asterophora parasitica TaxID=117018 RepID=A0A9P7G8C7_9AGAR|nr:hypothetical protein DXG03_009195 [Asterophora parasitica]
MTEYTTSSQAMREYMTSRQRTAYWVQSHEETEFYSPSAPPIALGDAVPPSPAISVAESSGSIPPRMVLRFNNGQPDIPIPVSDESARSGRSQRRREHSGTRSSSTPRSPSAPSGQRRGRSGSHPSSPLAQSFPHDSDQYPGQAPEEIRILPSLGSAGPIPSTAGQPRSRSLPRSPAEPPSHRGAPPLPGPMPMPRSPLRTRTPYPHLSTSASRQGSLPPAPHSAPPTQETFTPEPWHPYAQSGRPPPLTHQKQPPAIIYAPSHLTSRPRYAPPAIYSHPPQMGPNGMTYSHSAPVHSATQQAQQGHIPSNLPSTMVPPALTLAQVREQEMEIEQRGGAWKGRTAQLKYGYGHDRARSLSLVPHPPPLRRSPSSSSLGSRDSEGTYYVLPADGQKVHVIVSCSLLATVIL